jgi:hypothetical protein
VSANVPNAWVGVSPLDAQLAAGGLPPFERSYPLTTLVTLIAPPLAGGAFFSGWSLDGGPVLPGSTQQLTLEASMHSVEAVYQSASTGVGCGLGGEVAPLLAALLWLRRARVRAGRAARIGLLALASLTAPSPASAQGLCPAGALDTDLDGFCNAQETAGIALFGGGVVVTNPNVRDLFVIIVRLDPSCSAATDPTCIPRDASATDLISAPPSSGGLGIAVHEISAAQAASDRRVSPDSTQKAVRITESALTSSSSFGDCNWGTPNGFDECVIYPRTISSYVSRVCAGKSSCRLSTGEEGIPAVVRRYVKHTLNHEIGHSLQLTALYTVRFNGNHQKVGAGVVMEQSSVYTDKGGRVTWYIATAFGGADQSSPVLKLPF